MEIIDVIKSSSNDINDSFNATKNNYPIEKAFFNVTSFFEGQEELIDIIVLIAKGRIQNEQPQKLVQNAKYQAGRQT